MLRTRRATGEKRLIISTSFLVLLPTKCGPEEAPHLTCHVLCTSLRTNSFLFLPPLLISVSIMASLTLRPEDSVCLSFFLSLKCFYFMLENLYLSIVNGFKCCVYDSVGMYPDVGSRKVIGPHYYMIEKGNFVQQCLHSLIEMYSAASRHHWRTE